MIEVKNFLTQPDMVEFSPGVRASRLNNPAISGLSADLIRFQPHAELPEHTHPERNHTLIVLLGIGWISVEAECQDVAEGDTVDINGADLHSLGAQEEDFWVLSIGVPPADLFAADRMTFKNGLYKPTRLAEADETPA